MASLHVNVHNYETADYSIFRHSVTVTNSCEGVATTVLYCTSM